MTNNLPWLAGVLEGEGCFYYDHSPRISVSMTDKDVIETIAQCVGCKVRGPFTPRGKNTYKPVWTVAMGGRRALELMIALFPFMHTRRCHAIEEILSKWEHTSKRTHSHKYLPVPILQT